MTRRRWIADEVSGDRAALLGSHAEHLVRVLRAQVGQEFDIVTEGRVRHSRIASVSPQRVEFQLLEEVPAGTVPQVEVLLSIFKFDRYEWAVEKLTELGAARIVPVIARRTDAHLASAAGKRVERWRKIAHQAAEQSRRLTPPALDDPDRTAKAITATSGTRIVLAESEQGTTLKQALASASQPVTLAFGPEGGWTNEELDRFAEHGWVSASLGSTILRAETAAIAALAITMAELSAAC